LAKLLFVLPRFHTNLWFAMRALTGAGHEVRLLVNFRGPFEDYTHADPIEMGDTPDTADLDAAIDAFGPDIGFIRNARSLSRRASRILKARGIPCLAYDLNPMDAAPGFSRRAKLWWQGKPLRRITPVAGRGAPDPFATYMPWPVAALPANPAPRRDGRLAVLCVGKVGQARKNQTTLIEAIRDAGLDTQVALTLIGAPFTGTDRDAAQGDAIAAAGAAPWITVAPPTPFREMAALYAASDVCILPSLDEPLGVAPVEAMAYGAVPVISDQAGSAGYLTHGRDGFVVDATRPETMTEAIRALLVPAQRSAMSAAARDTVAHALSEARFLQRMHALLEREGIRD
jgi:glycosyltransferase involved in cell wall biosynthesis